MCEGICRVCAFRVCLIEFLYVFSGRAIRDPEAPPGGSRPSQEGLPPLCGPQHGYRQENGLSRNHPPRWLEVFVAGRCSTCAMVMFIFNCLQTCERGS